MSVSPLNPYRLLASQARALLKLEADRSAEQRAQASWMLRVEFAKTYVVVGKGGANTMWAQYGDGERVVNYPNKIIGALDRLGRQEYVMYFYVVNGKGQRHWKLASAQSCRAIEGARIVGVRADGARVTAYVAKRSVRGGTAWVHA